MCLETIAADAVAADLSSIATPGLTWTQTPVADAVDANLGDIRHEPVGAKRELRDLKAIADEFATPGSVSEMVFGLALLVTAFPSALDILSDNGMAGPRDVAFMLASDTIPGHPVWAVSVGEAAQAERINDAGSAVAVRIA